MSALDLPSGVDPLVAILPPLVVWLLWRGQVFSVEVLRSALLKLLRHAKWLYNVVSWFGTFLHEMSHASVLLLSGHGIKQFRVSTDSGHVLPRRVRKGPVGFLFFLVAALAPLFGPPILVLVALWLLVDRSLIPLRADWGIRMGDVLAGLGVWAQDMTMSLVNAIVRLDLSQPWHIAALFAILVGIPGSRPSHVKGSKFHGENDEGDVAVVRKRIRKNPWPVLILLAVIMIAYYPLAEWAPAVYWYPFMALWAVAVTAIVLALLGALWWLLVAYSSGAQAWLSWLPFAAFGAVQWFGHTQGGAPFTSLPAINGLSLAAFAFMAVVLRFVAPRQKGLKRLGL